MSACGNQKNTFVNGCLLELNGQFADKPTCGQSSCRLVNSQPSQLANSEFF